MRTTLDLDGDILQAVKEIARKEHSSAGSVLSDLARQALSRTGNDAPLQTVRNGVPVFAARAGEIVTGESVAALGENDL